MIYDFTVLALQPGTLGAVLPLLPETYRNFTQHGRMLGAFSCEFGVQNRFAFLAAYDDAQALAAERARLMASEDPYGIGQYLAASSTTACKPLNFTSPIVPGDYGPFYEIRSYTLAPGAIPNIEETWGKVVPRRNAISPLLMVMASIDAAPQRLIHIYPYRSIEQRQQARAQASKEGIWPPPGGSVDLRGLANELWSAQAYSDLK